MAQMILVGILFGIVFGFIDVIIDTRFFYDHVGFFEAVFNPDPVEIYIRGSVLFLFIGFGYYTGKIMTRLEEIKDNLENEIAIRKKTEEELQIMATHDSLTSVFNRRAFIDHLSQNIEQAKRYEHDLSMLICDLDHFKTINDTVGHAEGDRILQEFAALLKISTRRSDVVARYGGEEFIVLTPYTGLETATMLAEKIRKATNAELSAGKKPVTVSIGVAQWEKDEDIEDMLYRADKALYRAKHHGRNNVFSA